MLEIFCNIIMKVIRSNFLCVQYLTDILKYCTWRIIPRQVFKVKYQVKTLHRKKAKQVMPHLKEQWVREGDAVIGCSLFCWSHCSPTLTDRHRGFANWRDTQPQTKYNSSLEWRRSHERDKNCGHLHNQLYLSKSELCSWLCSIDLYVLLSSL